MTFSSASHTLRSSALVLFGLCYASIAIADDEIDALLEMDLEELTVSVASKKEESIHDAPGIVNVITRRDIETYGATTLHDLFRRLPNVFPFSQSGHADRVIGVRAQHQGSVDEHLLVLINGRPHRTSYATGLEHGVLFRNFPIDTIERIELIRGPGSVLYGSNAIAGVVNIITQKPKNDGEMHHQVSALYGSNHKATTDYTAGQYLGENSYYQVSVRANDERGAHYQASNSGRNYDRFYGSQEMTGFADIQHGNWRVNAYRAYTHFDSVGTASSEVKHKTGFFDLGYEGDLDGNWKTNLNATVNKYDYTSGNSVDVSDTFNILLEGNISGSPFENAQLLVGVNYNNLQGDKETSTSYIDYNESWRNFYGQLDYWYTPSLKFIAGIQGNNTLGNKFNLSPRAGFIYHATDHIGTKLLYSNAFRSPTGLEKYAPITATRGGGNPGLKDETTRTIDWQVYYDDKKHFIAATLYRTVQSDTITFDTENAPLVQDYQNRGTAEHRGLELEGKWRINPNWRVQGSYVYQTNELDGVHDLFDVPEHMVKLGFDYDSLDGIRVGVFNSYFASPAIDYNRGFNNNPAAEDFSYLTANVDLNIKKLWGSPAWPDTRLSFYGDNLLESDYVFYGGPADRDRTAPNFIGRSFFARLSVKF